MRNGSKHHEHGMGFKRRHAWAAGAVLIAAMPLAAFASSGESGSDERRDPARMERMAQHMAERNAALREKLNLRADQKTAWDAFAAALTPGAPPERPDRAKMEAMTTLQRLDLMAQHRASRMQDEQKRETAIRTFYGQLDGTQRTAFDQNFRFGPGVGRHGRGHHGDGHRGGRHGGHGRGHWGGGPDRDGDDRR